MKRLLPYGIFYVANNAALIRPKNCAILAINRLFLPSTFFDALQSL